MADKIFLERDYNRAKKYADEVRKAKLMVKSGRNLKISHLHKYVRFLNWLTSKYGEKTFESESEAKCFLLEKIDAIANDTSDFDSFWTWVRTTTLSEGSRILME